MARCGCVLLSFLIIALVTIIKDANSQLVLSGRPTSASLHPYAVMVNNFCGGSIIHPSWVLTAGHCMRSMNEIKTGDGVTRGVSAAYRHPGYKVGPDWAPNFSPSEVWARFDFALLKLKTPIVISAVVAPIALSNIETTKPDLVGKIATYSFVYTYVRENRGVLFPEMFEGEFKTWPDSSCKNELEDFDSNDMLCAHGFPPLNSYACYGDSGSGFVMNKTLVGISSWVEDDNIGCKKGSIIVFAKVAAAVPWIRIYVPHPPPTTPKSTNPKYSYNKVSFQRFFRK